MSNNYIQKIELEIIHGNELSPVEIDEIAELLARMIICRMLKEQNQGTNNIEVCNVE